MTGNGRKYCERPSMAPTKPSSTAPLVSGGKPPDRFLSVHGITVSGAAGAGGTAGAITGATIGASVGAIAGPVGAGIGFLIGFVSGALGGAAGAGVAARKVVKVVST